MIKNKKQLYYMYKNLLKRKEMLKRKKKNMSQIIKIQIRMKKILQKPKIVQKYQ